jgi:RNA polymerase sigma factor (sigma-70 family)
LVLPGNIKEEMATDADLVTAARAGERAAFAALVARHRGRARAAALRLLADPHEAEDVAQEAVLQAYLGLARLRDPDRFGGWLSAIALNLARMRLRRARTHDDLVGGRVLPLASEPAPEETVEAAELFVLVRETLAELSPRERETVLLYYVDGLSSREIASRLGHSPVAVRVRLHRARARLRERLGALGIVPTNEEDRMLEVEIQEVVTRLLPSGELANARLRVILLREKGGERLLPIWVGAAEGDALALQLAGEDTPRPLTVDLAARLVEATGARVEHVAVSRLEEKTFYAVVSVRGSAGARELDARPSDAINLAVRTGAPVLVDQALLDQAGVTGSLDERLDEEDVEAFGAPREGAWTSVSPELVRATLEGPKPNV